VVLAGALAERGDRIAREFAESCLLGSGQFCTSPGLIILPAGEDTEYFIARASELFARAPMGTLLSEGTERNLADAVARLRGAGAKLLTGGEAADPNRFCHANTLLRVSGREFLRNGEFQTEAFGNAALILVSENTAQTCALLEVLEGNLTGCIYSCTRGADDNDYAQIAPYLRRKVGRLLNDKMPTGVAVSPAMNHGGPFPASGHPGFTAVGIPASLRRFACLQCYDNVRPERLPPLLANRNPGNAWRLIDGNWSRENI
jgi:NADP-dependent aldehyde dehydrogenase